MSAVTRHRVLKLFRQLHKTKCAVFQDDDFALGETRSRINEEFKKGKDETDPEKIEELIKTAEDVDMLLRKTVIQAKLVGENRYRLKITKDTYLEDNYPFDPNADLPEPLSKRKGKRGRKTCEEIHKELEDPKLPS
ncbi:Complex III assembly factor LYRM7 [Mizuhopecten yessoensis]|uniref:Complex III assembly factor LYRM7 n=2 Tax=Mizuhopecten yessoensis TaxID=6573 RepID=A0A210QFW5_MIZYE|nr:Complex III assembly factor LYRM7 [Mizuhopecten yessoensis]